MFASIRFLLYSLCPAWAPRRTLDLLTATASDIELQLNAGSITSRQLVIQYFEQIGKYDGYLKAVLVKSPEALRQADALDEERRAGLVRGPLHGIPVLLKDNIATNPDLGMDTTAGSLALVGSRPRKNAEIVDRLTVAGMIILGKTNLSELSGFKGSNIMPGWSALGGQTQSAYTIGDVDLTDGPLGQSSPGGSSTGSAVAVSAGFAPVALGTDTCGSLITPCTRAGLYTIRPTINLLSQHGIIPISTLFDTAGPIAKSPTDLANLLDALVDQSENENGSYASALPGNFSEINIGVLSPEDWFFGPDLGSSVPSAKEQITRDTRKAYEKLKPLAKSFQEVKLISGEELQVKGTQSSYDIQTARFKGTFENYLETLETSRIRTLKDLIRFNEENKHQEMPPEYNNQEHLITAANVTMTDDEHDRLLSHARTISRERGIDLTLKEYGVDVIIAPADSGFNILVSSAGYPSATMPLSTLDCNGRPFGLAAFTTANGEKLLLKVLSAWEEAFPKRPIPKHLGG